MNFDIYDSVHTNSCKYMVNKKTFGSALCSIPPCLNLPGPESEHVTKTLVLLLLFEGPRVPQGSSEKKQAGGGDGGAGGSAGCCGRVV